MALAISAASAQFPHGITHQAVIRDASNELVTNTEIGVKVSIIQGTAEGTVVYSETHTPESNAHGLITYIIGTGDEKEDAFDQIDWSAGPYFLKTEADPDGGQNYTISATTQFLSVPYALYSLGFEGSMDGRQIVNLAAPVAEHDAANKAYVDQLLERIEILEEEIFKVADVDGNVYRTLKIGDQVWMAANLRTTKYRNEDPVATGLDDSEWGSTTDGAYAMYDDDSAMSLAYGNLYNWFAIDDTRGLCPEGWRVASSADWTQLVDYLQGEYGWTNDAGDTDGVGNNLKSCRQIGSPLEGDCDTSDHPRWKEHATHHGKDHVGFSALPGGYRHPNGNYSWLGHNGYWWTSTEDSHNPDRAACRRIQVNEGSVGSPNFYKNNGFSVRCIRNE